MTGTWDAPLNILRPVVLINTIQDRNGSLGAGGWEPARAYITTVHEKRCRSDACTSWHAGPGTTSEEEEGFIAREGIEHSQNRPPQPLHPLPRLVVGELVRRVAAPATKTTFYWIHFSYLS